jgi:hypothetical protein
MVVNRIFICHVIRSEKPEEAQILRYITEVLEKTGMEIVTHKDDSSERSFFQQLQQELPMCQTFLLLPDAIYASGSKSCKEANGSEDIAGNLSFFSTTRVPNQLRRWLHQFQ